MQSFPETYNLAADGKVNYALSEANLQGVTYQHNSLVTMQILATITQLSVDDLSKMSTEEIAKSLTCQFRSTNRSYSQYGASFDCDLLKGSFRGKELQNGNSALYVISEDKVNQWKKVCEKAKTFAKQAGIMPVALERIISEVLEVKPPWRTVLRFGLRNSVCVDSSFAYANRRNDDLPGAVGYVGVVWCLIDTSASISEEVLECFLGIVKYEARNALVRVISWDVASYEVLKVERPSEVARRIVSKLKGGGGTICLPVLQHVYKLMNTGDFVIMLTDGDIFDADKSQTQQWFKKVANKASCAVIGYTNRPLQAPSFNNAHITFYDNKTNVE